MALIDLDYSELEAMLVGFGVLIADLNTQVSDLAERVTALESGGPIPDPGASFYVAPDGDDNADGTIDHPWQTWNRARLDLVPGDTLHLLPGDHDHFLDDTGSEHRIEINGNEDYPITIVGENAIIPYVTLEGQGLVLEGISGSYLFNRCNYLTIRDCTFHGGSSQFNVITLFHDHHHITIDGCELSGSDRSGVDTLGVSDVIIRNCNIHHTGKGVQIKKGSRNVLVTGCDIHDFTEGAILGLGTTCTGDCQVTGAAWVRDPEMPISERYQAKDVIIDNNHIYNGQSWATVRLGGWRDYQFSNNDMHDLDVTGRLSYVFRIDSQHWEFKDATALAYEPHRDCDEPCSSEECNRIILHSGPGGVILQNTIRDFGDATLLHVVTPCVPPEMTDNTVER